MLPSAEYFDPPPGSAVVGSVLPSAEYFDPPPGHAVVGSVLPSAKYFDPPPGYPVVGSVLPSAKYFDPPPGSAVVGSVLPSAEYFVPPPGYPVVGSVLPSNQTRPVTLVGSLLPRIPPIMLTSILPAIDVEPVKKPAPVIATLMPMQMLSVKEEDDDKVKDDKAAADDDDDKKNKKNNDDDDGSEHDMDGEYGEWVLPREPMSKLRSPEASMPPEANMRGQESSSTRRFISYLRRRAWLPMAVFLTGTSVAYIAYSDRSSSAAVGNGSVERFSGFGNDEVQVALAKAIAELEAGSSEAASKSMREVHAALEAKYARHADAHVAASCGALALALLLGV
ncbi:MAG: hypothetical protein B7Z66_15690 [Chromatiales bacterium 21-64-14]|nr:MAG: hypothetical protein B7Z66_15690 [Chromatiales bacterium 21-64-14]